MIGAAYGFALDFAAAAASGYDQDSFGLDSALVFAAGFPLSLLPVLSTIYFLALTPPLAWSWIGWTLARRRDGVGAEWTAPVLLLMQCLGLLLAPFAFVLGRLQLFHWSLKTSGGLALFGVLWTIGFAEAMRRLARPPFDVDTATTEPRSREAALRRAALAVALLLAAAGVLVARPRIAIVCASPSASCAIASRGDARTWPLGQVRVRPGVPYSTLEVGLPGNTRTMLRVHCADVIVGGNFFNRCESRGGRLLADLEAFLLRPTPEGVAVQDDEIEGAAFLAGALACAALWVLASVVRGRQSLTFNPT